VSLKVKNGLTPHPKEPALGQPAGTGKNDWAVGFSQVFENQSVFIPRPAQPAADWWDCPQGVPRL